MATSIFVYAIVKSQDRFLLLKRPKCKKIYPGHWNFPGGKKEGFETVEECLRREVREETDLVFFPQILIMDDLVVLDTKKGKRQTRVKVYFGDAYGQIKLNQEHIRYGYFTLGQIKRMKTLPFVKKSILLKK